MTPFILACVLALQDPPQDLTELSLEELSKLEVTTASRKAQRLADVPAAVSVIRGDDLRRTGVRSVQDALRMVPGANVARIDGNKWAISVRGFHDRFSNKLQVLVDGRSVYTPLFSGVFWEAQDTLIEDIDRIEVVRGPGGATWGANAVNGVINIITKKAADTRGTHVHAGAGGEERAFGGARYGGASGGLAYRAFAKAFDRDEQFEGEDDTFQARAGFRADWTAGPDDLLTVSGEYYDGEAGVFGTLPTLAAPFRETVTRPYALSGGHLLARWDRRLGDAASISAQLSYTRSDYDTHWFREVRDTVDLDASHLFRPFEGHDVIWGLGYRMTRDHVDGGFFITMEPERVRDDVVSLFLQDEIALSGEDLKLVLGARAEHNDYTGLEVSPTARLAFRPHERHMLWAAVSRATRTPSRSNDSIRANVTVIPPPAGPLPVTLSGNHDTRSERLLALEAGYRVTPAESLSFDVALFLNDYDRLQTTETVSMAPPAQVNGSEGTAVTYGLELAASWQIVEGWRLTGAYTFLHMNFDQHGGSNDTSAESQERSDPRAQIYLRSSMDLTSDLSLDLMGRYVGALPALDVDRYFDLDARLAWRPARGVELSIVGQNLLDSRHFKHGTSPIYERPTEVERSAYLMVRWDF